MNPLFRKLFKQKKTRARDPNAPPPPTLLGQVKELRTTKEAIEQHNSDIAYLRNRVEYLEAKSRNMESTIEAVRSWISKSRSR
jgi:predicted  nucleic acid-binding Zn-ribbon protein